jgi:hypothetical protein
LNNEKKEKAHATTHCRAETGSIDGSGKNRDEDDEDDDEDDDDDDEAAGAEEARRRKQKKREKNGGNDALDAPREARTTRIGRAPGSEST